MRLTKFGHACVRIEYDGQTVVIDPGVFTDAEAVDGADAVLITHEHADHYLPDHLRRVDAPVFTIDAVAAKLREEAPDVAERTTVVAPAQDFTIGPVGVRVVGEKHAVIHPDLPHFDNSGFLLTLGDLTVFHPGDSFTVPGSTPDLLLLPVSAPWLKVSESIDYAREVGAAHNLSIHERVFSDAGLGIVDGHVGRLLGASGLDFTRIADGEDYPLR